MVIKVYVSRTSGNVLMKLQQDHIRRTLDCKQIGYEEVDIADPRYKQDKLFMQKTLALTDDDLIALPPQIFNNDQHRGDYESFLRAVECETLYHHLDLTVPTHEVEYLRKLEAKFQTNSTPTSPTIAQPDAGTTTATITHFPTETEV